MKNKRLGILVGGGPAPGINGVIRSVTIEARNSDLEVIGFYDGFSVLMEGKTAPHTSLSINDVSRIHDDGGSFLRTSRANPTKDSKKLGNVFLALKKLSISYLVTIGGDDTAYSAFKLSEKAGKNLHVAHVPKTIDNDLMLPGLMPTFGFHTARHYGTQIVSSLMEDAKTTSRWFFVVSMGRKAGHLALGIAKASGATLALLGEEFQDRKITLKSMADILEGAIIKRLAMGKPHGLAVLAEGLIERLELEELKKNGDIKRDPHGNIRFEEIDIGRLLKGIVESRLHSRGIQVSIVAKNIGYELRCMPPIPFDLEYTLDLGYSAVRYLIEGGSSALISIKRGGTLEAIPLKNLIDPHTGRMEIRPVDLSSDSYHAARKYMIRLEKSDFKAESQIKKMARAGKMSVDEFKKRFGYLF